MEPIPWSSHEEEELVQAPPPSGGVRPGHLWQGEDASKGIDEGLALPETTPTETSMALTSLRKELMKRLDAQDCLLREILCKSVSGYAPSASRGPSSASVSLEESLTSEVPNKVEATESMITQDNFQLFDLPPPDVMEIQSPCFTPTAIFSPYDEFEAELFEKAELSEVKRHRSLYALGSKGRSDLENSLTQWIVRHNYFAFGCALVVIINSIFIGVEVQMSLDHPEGLPLAVNVIQYSFATFFVLELILRICADGRRFFCGEDWKWSWLDIFVVMTSLWEVFADVLVAFQIEGMSGLKALRIMRITRIMKVVRLMRVFRFVMAFRTLIASIAETLKSLFWALMLLGVVIYVFAVLFTQAVNDYIAEPDNPMPEELRVLAVKYFGSLYDTMLSLFESIANGVSWNQVLAPLRYISPIWAVVYLFYIFFTYFTVLNVVTAVFCQAAVETAQNDHAAMVQSVLKNKKAHCEKLQHLFSTLGDQCTGTITFKMLQDRMNCPKVRAYFEVLGLDIWDAWSFFKLLDDDASGDVAVEDFLLGCLRLRGQASAIDMGKLLHDQTWLMKNLGKFQTHVAQEFHHLRKEIRAIEPKLNSKSPVSVSRSITRGKSPLPSSSATTPTMSRHIDELAQIVKTSRELRDVSLERKSPRAERLQTGEGEG
ncbi:Voltage-dependent T-type calcium channel subunit alpha-1I (CaVT.3) (Voltage-gated calcium channel subunit alpha Cav3.3) [Durusdinium trenchii]|uniref:Voltage-dependent T-type calcium channel subunit alpha-1I (CaVT.3) (Voltage-gated calcium channel subunit alpha Cav3.3) n=1 Tax=Durusdinium trenchii TaxID=1381693 RepID=A0ABP0SMB3_9DINO